MSVSGILLIDKPRGFTSQDAVAVVRRVFSTRRVGHTGTLDPMATGLLIVCLGRATRAVDFLMGGKKVYEASFKIGAQTDTGDITGEIIETSDITPSKAAIEAALSGFTGEISQVPPMYSAIKRGGVPLYKLARKGETVEREARTINIESLELLEYNEKNREGRFLVSCSKGTYIRTLIEDIALSLGTRACMSGLRRTRNGAFSIESAITIDALRLLGEEGRQNEALISVDTVFENYPALELGLKEAEFIKHGRDFECPFDSGSYRAYAPDGEFLGLVIIEGGVLRTIKSFFETDVNHG